MLKTILFSLASISVLIFVFLLSFFPIQDSDIFIYLSIGRWFLNYGTWPVTESFVFSSTAPFQFMNEWASIMFYTYAFKWGNYVGLIAVKGLLIVLIFMIPIALTIYLKNFSAVPLILAVAAALASSHRFIERASTFSDMFTALTLAIVLLEYHRPGRLKYVLPFLFLVWANFHPSFIIGLSFVYLLLGFQVLSKLRKFSAPNKELLPLGIVAVVTTLATMATPVGYHSLFEPLKMMFDPSYQFYSQFYQEFLPVYKHYRGQVELYSFYVLSFLMVCIFAVYIKNKNLRFPFFELIIFLVMFYSTMKMSRMISSSSYCFMVLGTYMYAQIRSLDAQFTPVRSRLFTSAAFATLVISLVGILAASYIIYDKGYHFAGAIRRPQGVFQFPIDTRHQPVRAVQFFQGRRLTGNIFNEHAHGGYLLWAWNGNPPIFYHGMVHDPDLYLNNYIGLSRSPADFQRVVKKYNIHYFILENLFFIPKNQLPPPYTLLLSNPEWKLTFQDEAAVVFEKVEQPEEPRKLANDSKQTDKKN